MTRPGLLPLLALSCGGCFYVPPAWEPQANRAPVVITPPAPHTDIPLLMDRDTRLTVVGRDPESEPLDFVWIVPVDVEFDWTTSTEGELWYSVLEIAADPLLDKQRLEVILSDGDLEESVSWRVEIP